MANMLFRTKDNIAPSGKARVYFTCHPDDFNLYFEQVCEYIFKSHNCAVYYTEDMSAQFDEADKVTDLESNNLFVVPVTFKLLSTKNRAMDEEKGIVGEQTADAECLVDLNISAHIPESYIESLPARLGIYKRIAAIRNDDDASDVIDELCDRFGDPPPAVMGLIDISILRSKAANAKIAEITGTANTAILHINSIEPAVMGKLSAFFGNRFMLNAADKPVYTIRLNKGQKMSDLVAEIAKAL